MLTETEIAKLDKDGYVSLGQLLADEQVKTINTKLMIYC